MLNAILNNNKFNYWTLLVIVPILGLGIYGELYGEDLSWLSFLGAGLICLWLSFGTSTTQAFFRKMEGHYYVHITLAIVAGFLISFLFLYLGDWLGVSSGTDNPIIKDFEQADFIVSIVLLVVISISVAGEEVITASMTFLIYRLFGKKLTEKRAWYIAVLVGSVIFGLLHCSTYDGDLWQCLFVIGIGRLPFTYAWRMTNSLWGGICAHIIYDLIILIPVIVMY
ncbi:CPBP family intramembrane glutamic endopeptidase [Brochothrix campestris]|uniref:CAAX prenyl protease 2/Lysostaphin resistance protein A-like domain-containing protein n=1 Tax=Brochothrix campestris FSL F6-1037 TaxID=1265861 RepID=W7CU54_9LIST|nr:CPBP family intramembrane glutamic endopeptidase [Brochothrix campestris]EUJ39326.1 hypothetical protein BCAMP_07275 [Brochothrix campestris FSL F6-1037]